MHQGALTHTNGGVNPFTDSLAAGGVKNRRSWDSAPGRGVYVTPLPEGGSWAPPGPPARGPPAGAPGAGGWGAQPPSRPHIRKIRAERTIFSGKY